MDMVVTALERLREGNRRFVSEKSEFSGRVNDASREQLVAGQAPFAVVLGCSDSRVPVEIVFDQGLGDVFTIRVAGNIATPTQIASIEYAVQVLGSRLIVVLGHASCGAVQATLDSMGAPVDSGSPHLDDLIRQIRPSIDPLLEDGVPREPGILLAEAIRANVRAVMAELSANSKLIADLIQSKELKLVGAEYSLASGEVDFFDLGE